MAVDIPFDVEEEEAGPDLGTAVVKYHPTEAEIAKVRQDYADLAADPNCARTPEGMQQVKGALSVLVPMRTTIEKARQRFKAGALEYGRKVDAEAKRLTGLVLEIEGPIRAAKEAVEAEEEARARAIVEAREKEEAEARRKAEEAEIARRAAERAELEAERAKLREEQRQHYEQQRIDREAREREDGIRREAQRKLDEAATKLREEQDRIARAELDRVNAELAAARRVEEEKKEAAATLAREEAERRAEEEQRPDREKIRRFGNELVEWWATNLPQTTSQKAKRALLAAANTLTSLTQTLREYK